MVDIKPRVIGDWSHLRHSCGAVLLLCVYQPLYRGLDGGFFYASKFYSGLKKGEQYERKNLWSGDRTGRS